MENKIEKKQTEISVVLVAYQELKDQFENLKDPIREAKYKLENLLKELENLKNETKIKSEK